MVWGVQQGYCVVQQGLYFVVVGGVVDYGVGVGVVIGEQVVQIVGDYC